VDNQRINAALHTATTGTNSFNVQATDARGNIRTSTFQTLVGGTGATYTYDPNGNLIQKAEGSDTWTYEWDAENRLKRVLKNAAEVARFAYDPLGRRVEKVAAATTTSWTYDGEAILRETSGSTTLKYVHGPGVDEPLAQEDGAGALSFFHADGLGSVVKTTNSAGAVVTSRRYDSFGNVELGATNGYAFTGREWDNETGLAYYRARYYDPKIGRFINEDPIRFGGGANFYAYVQNNPVNFIDPSGLRLLLCNRKAKDMPGNHAYLWNEGPAPGVPHGANCGRGPSMGREGGPSEPGTYCVELPGSEGKEAEILNCCRHEAGPLVELGGHKIVDMIPYVNDCHNLPAGCLDKFGVSNPGAPGGRFGCRGGCTTTPNPQPAPPPGPSPD
jgi:RHS repeat-associated protein